MIRIWGIPSGVPFLFLRICCKYLYVIIFYEGNKYDIIVSDLNICFKMFQKDIGYRMWVCYNIFRRNLNQLLFT